MASRVNSTSQTNRPAPSRRRSRSTAVRRTTALARGPLTSAPPQRQPAEAAEAHTFGKPTLSWALITDTNGRVRPEARWV